MQSNSRCCLFLLGICLLSRHLRWARASSSSSFHAVIDDQLIDQLIRHAPDQDSVNALRSKDADAIFNVAKITKDKQLMLQVLHILADYQEQPHVNSLLAMAFYYYKNRQDKATSLTYFVRAAADGENNNNQLALYNAAKVAAELGHWVQALSYGRRAAIFRQSADDSKVTQSSKEAWEDICRQIATVDLTIEEAKQVFLEANLDGFPEVDTDAFLEWNKALTAIQTFNNTLTESRGEKLDQTSLEAAARSLQTTWDLSKAKVSKLQLHVLLHQTNHVFKYLTILDDRYLSPAAGHAEVLARTPYCYEWFATMEDDASCFNEAIASASSYYRRANDSEGSKRAMELATSHPQAATQWKRIEQTPRVFHSTIDSKPLWDSNNFQIALALQNAFTKHQKNILEGIGFVEDLYTKTKLLLGESPSVAEIDTTGEASILHDHASLFRSSSFDSRRVALPGTTENRMGGVDEFGPLHNGLVWQEEACAIVPFLCRTLQKHERHLYSDKSTNEVSVRRKRGVSAAVTLLRVSPGTHIFPRCGDTNGRLSMHLCLVGCSGLELSVGGVTVEEYDNGVHTVVFDDS
jgi:hypothetical protein